MGGRTSTSAAKGAALDAALAAVRDLEESRDLRSLGTVAESTLRGLRLLVERPSSAEILDEVLDRLEDLRLDPWELGEEE